MNKNNVQSTTNTTALPSVKDLVERVRRALYGELHVGAAALAPTGPFIQQALAELGSANAINRNVIFNGEKSVDAEIATTAHSLAEQRKAALRIVQAADIHIERLYYSKIPLGGFIRHRGLSEAAETTLSSRDSSGHHHHHSSSRGSSYQHHNNKISKQDNAELHMLLRQMRWLNRQGQDFLLVLNDMCRMAAHFESSSNNNNDDSLTNPHSAATLSPNSIAVVMTRITPPPGSGGAGVANRSASALFITKPYSTTPRGVDLPCVQAFLTNFQRKVPFSALYNPYDLILPKGHPLQNSPANMPRRSASANSNATPTHMSAPSTTNARGHSSMSSFESSNKKQQQLSVSRSSSNTSRLSNNTQKNNSAAAARGGGDASSSVQENNNKHNLGEHQRFMPKPRNLFVASNSERNNSVSSLPMSVRFLDKYNIEDFERRQAVTDTDAFRQQISHKMQTSLDDQFFRHQAIRRIFSARRLKSAAYTSNEQKKVFSEPKFNVNSHTHFSTGRKSRFSPSQQQHIAKPERCESPFSTFEPKRWHNVHDTELVLAAKLRHGDDRSIRSNSKRLSAMDYYSGNSEQQRRRVSNSKIVGRSRSTEPSSTMSTHLVKVESLKSLPNHALRKIIATK